MSGYVKAVALFTCAICVCLLQLQGAWALNVTCPSFDSLCETTYDNVAPQALHSFTITFDSNTESQILGSYCDALECRGSKVNVVNYNTLTLNGYISPEYCSQLEKSPHIRSVEEDSLIGTLARMPELKDYTELSYGAEQEALDSEATASEESESSSATGAIDRLPSLLIHASFACVSALAFTLL
ncbi:hypothetical protein EV175_003713 [Coemansia sp. RSA 1933]|nr:hypothetical protein EV175_003713 [Coemansia sp. RSA 1933]